MKILIVFGTRPEAIKMAPIVKALQSEDSVECRVCATAQHRTMLDQVMSLFEINPEYDLNLMKQNQTLGELTARLISSVDQVLVDYNPDWVLVHGDTTTSMAVSIASFYRKVRIGHVEAGLRTNDLHSPWPEEANRQITARMADLNFAPTEEAKNNLIRENIDPEKIVVTGNSVIDALLDTCSHIESNSDLQSRLNNDFPFVRSEKKMVLVTGHRRENFGSRFESICNALKVLATEGDMKIVFPVHLNPNVLDPVNRILGSTPNIYLLPPLEYVQFVFMLSNCDVVLTDSGGVQEEAPSLGKPVLVMRDNTERPEAVNVGVAKLVGTETERIVDEVSKLMNDEHEYKKMSVVGNPYGDGQTSSRIRNIFKKLSNE